MKKKGSMGGGLALNVRKYWPLYVMVIPGLVYLIMFRYIPIFGSVIAFQDYSVFKGITGSPFVGLKNFTRLFNSFDFGTIFSNTVILGMIKTVLLFPVPVIMALMINEIRVSAIKKSVQTAVYIPHFLSWVIVGGLVFDILGVGGLFNNIRAAMGLPIMLPMQKESWFRPIFAISSIWKESGWGTVVYLAALSGMDSSIYESASIDGASRMQRMMRITLPLLVPTILTMFLLNIGGFLDLGFEQVYNLQTPMTYNVSDIFDTYVYRAGILQAQYSYTTAVGLFQSVIGLVLVVTFNKLANKFTEDGGCGNERIQIGRNVFRGHDGHYDCLRPDCADPAA